MKPKIKTMKDLFALVEKFRGEKVKVKYTVGPETATGKLTLWHIGSTPENDVYAIETKTHTAFFRVRDIIEIEDMV